MVFACRLPPTKEEGRTWTLFGIQLVVQSLVYGVDPGVPSPKVAYKIFPVFACWFQKSWFKKFPHIQLAPTREIFTIRSKILPTRRIAKIPKILRRWGFFVDIFFVENKLISYRNRLNKSKEEDVSLSSSKRIFGAILSIFSLSKKCKNTPKKGNIRLTNRYKYI